MPKIIKNLRERIVEETHRQVDEVGYGATSIRSVAEAVGIGVGTIYNYYPSKDVMVATYIGQDWRETVDTTIREIAVIGDSDVRGVLGTTYEAVVAFVDRHSRLFRDPAAGVGFLETFGERHKRIIGHLTDMMGDMCKKCAVSYTDEFTEFLAEAMMRWIMEQKSFESFYAIVGGLFK